MKHSIKLYGMQDGEKIQKHKSGKTVQETSFKYSGQEGSHSEDDVLANT